MVIVNSTTLLFAGGLWGNGQNEGYADTAYLNVDSNTWTDGPDMSEARGQLTCNLVTKPFLGIVIIGGDCAFENRCTQRVDILNLETNLITSGKYFFLFSTDRSTWNLDA